MNNNMNKYNTEQSNINRTTPRTFILPILYVYCVYPAMSGSQQLTMFTEKGSSKRHF